MKNKQSNYKISHFFLVKAESKVAAAQQVKQYLHKNMLITYTDLIIHKEEIINGTDARFLPAIEEGTQKNMQFAQSMLTKLKNEGIETLDDLLTMQEGYLTKILHTLTHMIDGFIGVDSVLYNLIEDSHRVSKSLFKLFTADPKQYHLVAVRTGMLETSVLHL